MTSTERTALRERPGLGFEGRDDVSVVFSDIPVGMTIPEYRRRRAVSRPKAGRVRRALTVVTQAMA